MQICLHNGLGIPVSTDFPDAYTESVSDFLRSSFYEGPQGRRDQNSFLTPSYAHLELTLQLQTRKFPSSKEQLATDRLCILQARIHLDRTSDVVVD
jgi:hypothetical protein